MGCMEIGFQEQQVAPLSSPTDAYKEALGGILPPGLHGRETRKWSTPRY